METTPSNPRRVDVRITGGGAVFLFLLLTDAARAWVDAHVSDDHQMLGYGLAVEHRYALDLFVAMAEDGLMVVCDGSACTDGLVGEPPESADPVEHAESDEGRGRLAFAPPPQTPLPEPFNFEWLFLCWAWEAGYRGWDPAIRALARTLRGLERVGLIERHTIRRPDRQTHHGFVLTDSGRLALEALAGDWIEGARR
jgi:hypothetical protein